MTRPPPQESHRGSHHGRSVAAAASVAVARARAHRGALVGRPSPATSGGRARPRSRTTQRRRRHGRLRRRHDVRRHGAGRVRRAVPRPPELPAERGLAVLLARSRRTNKVTFDIDQRAAERLGRARSRSLIGAGDAPDLIPVTYPGQETQFVVRRRDPAGQRLRGVHAELPAEGRGLGPGAVPRQPRAGGRQVLPAPRPARVAAAAVLDRGAQGRLGRARGSPATPRRGTTSPTTCATLKAANPDAWPMSDRWSTTTTARSARP